MDNKIHYIPNEYPRQSIVIMYFKNGNRAKGMFYWNGGKPTFVSYGSEVTDNVVAWEYSSDYTNKG